MQSSIRGAIYLCVKCCGAFYGVADSYKKGAKPSVRSSVRPAKMGRGSREGHQRHFLFNYQFNKNKIQ